MFKKLLFIFTLIAVLSGFSIPSKVTKKADKAISKFYDTTDFTKQDILVSEVLNTKTKTDFHRVGCLKYLQTKSFWAMDILVMLQVKPPPTIILFCLIKTL